MANSCRGASLRTDRESSRGNLADVLYVLDRYPSVSETFVQQEIDELATRGYAVAVVRVRSSLRIVNAAGVVSPSRRLPLILRIASSHGWWFSRHPRRYLGFLWIGAQSPIKDIPFLALAPHIARVSPARHVHSHFAFQAATVARGVAELLHVKRSVTTHANDLYVHGRYLARRLKGAKVITISEANAKWLATRGIRSEVVHCGVDLAQFSFARREDQDIDILFVGRLAQKKGIITLLQALPLLTNVNSLSIVVAGDGPLAGEVSALCTRLGSAVTLTGAVDRSTVATLLRRARLLCLPCRVADDGDVDGIPVALMEAMALGIPVVTTQVSGIPELVGVNEGWLVPKGHDTDETALAAVLETALSAPEFELDRRASNARRRVENEFSLSDQAEGLIRAIDPG